MTVQEIINELNDHGFTDTSTTRKLALINDTVWDVCSREPWPFLEASVSLTFDGTSATPTNVPADFHQVIDIIRTDTGQPLQPLRGDFIDKSYGTDLSTVGDAQAYYFLAGTLSVYRVPVSTQTLKMRYLRVQTQLQQTDVEATILVPARHHRVITLGTLYKLYDLEDDTELSARFEQHYENKLVQMKQDVWMRQFDRPDKIAVIDDDDFDNWYV